MKLPPINLPKNTQVVYYSPKKYDSVSRYANTKRLQDQESGIYYHSTFNQFTFDNDKNFAYYKVTDKNANRIDLISKEAYNTTLYWSAIAIANNLIDPFNIPMGTILIIPDISSIQTKRGLF